MSACADLCEFACQLTLETGAPPHRLMPIVRRLRRLATSHARRCEVQCNGCPTCGGEGFTTPDRERGCYDIHPCPTCSTDTLEEAIRATCRELEKLRIDVSRDEMWDGIFARDDGELFAPVFQHDPRGFTVRLRLPSGAANGWDREAGWAVPTSRG